MHLIYENRPFIDGGHYRMYPTENIVLFKIIFDKTFVKALFKLISQFSGCNMMDSYYITEPPPLSSTLPKLSKQTHLSDVGHPAADCFKKVELS